MMLETVEGMEGRLDRIEHACRRLEARWAADRNIEKPETAAALDALWLLYLKRDLLRAEMS